MLNAETITAAELSAQRLLVVAPHPDDESLGCGGVISHTVAAGGVIQTVFVTDGTASHRNSRSWSRERLAHQRRREAIEALRLLGAEGHGCTFLNLRDSAMPARGSPEWQRALSKLAVVCRAFAPDLVLIPWRRDPHCDHRGSWQLAKDALVRAGLRPRQLEYAIWADEFGTKDDLPAVGEGHHVAVAIEGAAGTKRKAVAAHLSQTTDLIGDDPEGFRLSPETIARLTGPVERYWRPLQ